MENAEGSYKIYIKRNGKHYRLQTYPSEIQISQGSNTSTYEVLGLGEISLQNKPALKRITWEGFFTYDLTEPYVATHLKPQFYLSMLEDIKKGEEVVRLIITRGNPDGSNGPETNLPVTLEQLTVTDRGGEPGDIYYSVEWLEYRNYAPVMLKKKKSGKKVVASEEKSRAKEGTDLYVGASVIVNGRYYYDSYGSKPFGTATNKKVTITRIVSDSTRPYPILVGQLGWVKKNQLSVIKVGELWKQNS